MCPLRSTTVRRKSRSDPVLELLSYHTRALASRLTLNPQHTDSATASADCVDTGLWHGMTTEFGVSGSACESRSNCTTGPVPLLHAEWSGPAPNLFGICGSLLCSSSDWTDCKLPSAAALCRAVSPCSRFVSLLLEPYSDINFRNTLTHELNN